MISNLLLEKCRGVAYEDALANGLPSIFQIDYPIEVASRIAEFYKVDKNLVLCGVYLMDCMLGTSYKLGKVSDHIQLSYEKAKEVLSADTTIKEDEQVKILNCILDHHKTSNFYSLESEICANADCYKFLSIKGVIGGIHSMRNMITSDIVSLYYSKYKEKLSILSLDYCKNELKDQLLVIPEFLNSYKD